MNFAWHMFQDRNMISYIIVTHLDFPDQYANNFLKGLSNMLYERNAEFRKNPMGIQSLDAMARHVIMELQASFDGSPNFSAANLDIEEGKSGKTDKIQKTLNKVTDKMRGNLNRMFENQNELEQMEEKSDKIRNSAESFQVSATRLEKIARHRRYRAYLIIFAMLLSFCLLMYLVFRSPTPTAPEGVGPEAALAEAPLIGDSSSSAASADHTAVKASTTAKAAEPTHAAKSSTTVNHKKVNKP